MDRKNLVGLLVLVIVTMVFVAIAQLFNTAPAAAQTTASEAAILREYVFPIKSYDDLKRTANIVCEFQAQKPTAGDPQEAPWAQKIVDAKANYVSFGISFDEELSKIDSGKFPRPSFLPPQAPKLAEICK